MSLVARHLEAEGIPTVIAGSARDIVEECGVPRFLFSDFPLGNPLGRPWDIEMQRRSLGFALGLFETVTLPRTTVQNPARWSEDATWKERYARVDPERAEALRGAGDRRRAAQQRAQQEGRARSD